MSAMKSQEASSSASPCSYHVFLSFRGEDTRKTFTDHLYTALDQAGFHTFRDNDGIEKGEDMKSELEKAIRESRISIIVFSKNYTSSTWCLEELVMILKRRTFGHVVLPVFYDVDPSEVRKQIGSFEEAFTSHEEKLKSETGELAKEKLKDKVGIWRAALREVANLAGMNLQDQADGLFFRHEARFIKKIVKVVGDKLSRITLNIAPNLVGIHSRVKNIQLWLEDGPSNVGIVGICGMGGIGKTTIAKLLYDLNFSRFEGSSFLENVREISQQQDGLLRLQRKFLSDILMTKKVKLKNIVEGTAMIKDAICCKKVFVVLDDVDKLDQLEALLGVQGWIFPGSKIIITTRRERLLGACEFYKVHRLTNLSDEESLELFSWHAFGKCCPNNGYGEVSKRVVSYCGGIPLAIKVLGSSLSGNCLNVWKSQLEKLEAIADSQIVEKLRISYDSLQDDHDKRLFLNLACFFVGSNKDSTVTILDGCEFYTVVGIQNLVDRCLISIDESKTLVMHHLLQQMGREIVRQESKEPGKRSILWNHKDAFNVLRENTGTSEIEGIKLDKCLLKEEAYACTVFGDNRKRRYEDFLGKPLLSNLGCSLKRYGVKIFSSHLEPTYPENSNPVALKADAFVRMNKLKLLQLNRVHITGPYKQILKGLRWLCWRGFPLKSIPSDFPLESLVALDMQYSCLKSVWEGTKACYETHIIWAYTSGSKVPPWFNFKNLGSSIDFIVPSYLNSRIRGLNLCSVYEDRKLCTPHTVINNRTKGLVWSHSAFVIGIAEDGEDTMWLSYWKLGNYLEGGDEVNVSVYEGELLQVKEVGVRLLYKEEQEEMSSQSAYEDKVPNQRYQFGNVSAQQPGTKLYQLGCHPKDCKDCQHLYDYDPNLECWASALMMGTPFYVSQDLGR